MEKLQNPFHDLTFPLLTRRLALGPVDGKAIPELLAGLQDREVTRTVPLPPRYTISDARQFVRSSQAALRDGTRLELAIRRRTDGRFLGMVGLKILSREHAVGHLGYWIARPFWGQGYATEAATKVYGLAFRTLKLHRLETGVFPGNERSIRILRGLGFRREGVFREAYRIDGKWRDSLRFGVLSTDPRPSRGRRPSPRRVAQRSPIVGGAG